MKHALYYIYHDVPLWMLFSASVPKLLNESLETPGGTLTFLPDQVVQLPEIVLHHCIWVPTFLKEKPFQHCACPSGLILKGSYSLSSNVYITERKTVIAFFFSSCITSNPYIKFKRFALLFQIINIFCSCNCHCACCVKSASSLHWLFVCMCFWIPTICPRLGSVLWLLLFHWFKQSPPSDQCYRWNRAVVAEPPSLKGSGLQRGECYPGPWAGEITILNAAVHSRLPAATCSVCNDCYVVKV